MSSPNVQIQSNPDFSFNDPFANAGHVPLHESDVNNVSRAVSLMRISSNERNQDINHNASNSGFAHPSNENLVCF
jgi:hypothetical protein